MTSVSFEVDLSEFAILLMRHVVAAYLTKRSLHLPPFLRSIGHRKRVEEKKTLYPPRVHIQALREKLTRDVLQKPKLFSIQGIFYPALLLAPAWWERQGNKMNAESFTWRVPLQEWLFQGFELWGPSWDLNDEQSEYFVGQIGWIDEVNSLLVIAEGRPAALLREHLLATKTYAFPVEIRGTLLHRSHLISGKRLPFSLPRGEAFEYCLLVEDKREHGVAQILTEKSAYSAYLWKCLAPRDWLQVSDGDRLVSPTIEQSFFIWEHADLTNWDALQFALESLEQKSKLLESRYGELILLQKSAHFVLGDPVYPIRTFKDFLENLSSFREGNNEG